MRQLECLDVSAGETATFECQVEGNPRPTITWFRHSAIIKPSDRIQLYYDEDNTAKLIIKEVYPEDSGRYTVVAKNVVGATTYTVELDVDGEFRFSVFTSNPISTLSCIFGHRVCDNKSKEYFQGIVSC